jgi:hypothetical protein
VGVHGVKQGAFATLHKAHPPGQGQSLGACSFGQHGQDESLHGFEERSGLHGVGDGVFSSVPSAPEQYLHFGAFGVVSSAGVVSGIALGRVWLRIK